MPLERENTKFKDISMSFKTNPLNDDLIALKNTNAIARSLKNIVFTRPGEKFFNPDFGSRITESLFENVDDVSALAIEDEIKSSIINFEPRVNLLDVKVTSNEDDNEMIVVIQYEITGIDVPSQRLEFALLPTR
tara:strand:- start:1023 stop:1424 length:402 start_codon:yes stop_codon:yes gene_type:complete